MMTSKVAVVACENYSEKEIRKQLERALELLGGIEQFVKPLDRVLIKPNLCLPQPPERCLTTHPEIVKQLALICSKGDGKIIVGDNPVGDATEDRLDFIWNTCGMESSLKEINYARSLINKDMQEFKVNIDDSEYSYLISREVLECEVLINVPKFKTHCLMTYTGAVKNLYGLLPGNSKKTLHYQLPEHDKFAKLLAHICSTVKPTLNVLDAVIGIEGDGPGMKGEIRPIGLIMISSDAVALDAVASKIMGLEPYDIPTTVAGAQLGVGQANLNNIELLGDNIEEFIAKDYKIPKTSIYHKDLTKKLFRLSKSNIKINKEICIRCKLCINNCPAAAIDTIDNGLEIIPSKCIGCMSCHEICPSAAIEAERPLIYQQLKDMKNRKARKE